MHLNILLILFLSVTLNKVYSLEVSELPSEHLEKIAKSLPWLKLLHYKKIFIHGYESDADGGYFFLSNNGKTDPVSELKENLKQIDQSLSFDNKTIAYQCLFPARYLYLTKEFELNLKSETCTELDWWMERLNPKSISMIYSSSYPNNPASIFGHTFLRFNRGNDGREFQDFAVDFAAATDVSSGVIFAIKGLTGGYVGKFSLKPYYVKVNEYVYGESRDLWEYLLNYSEEETRFIALHLWELIKNTIFDYYFFDENCSYQLLTLLEVARPEIKLSKLHFFYTLPPQTIKQLSKEKIIQDSSVRPSLRKQFIWKMNELDDDEYKKYYQFLNKQIKLDEITNVEILETLIAFKQYQQAEKTGNQTSEEFKNVLLHRAKIGGKSKFVNKQLVDETRKEDPLKSHDPSRISISHGYHSVDKSFINSEFRLGLHGLSDHQTSYPLTSQIEYGRINAKYMLEGDKFLLEDYNVVDIISLYPVVTNDIDKSWSISLGGEHPKDLQGKTRLAHFFQTNFGASYQLKSMPIVLYLLPGVKVEVGSSLEKSWRYGPITRSGVFLNFNRRLGLNMEFNNFYDINNNYQYDFLYRLKNVIFYGVTTNFQVRLVSNIYSLSTEKNSFETENRLGFDYYF